jgi:iron-sulfur cluster assembly protein
LEDRSSIRRSLLMLNLTTNAASAIRSIADRTERPADAGLRIASDAPGSGRLTVSAAVQPEESDHVVEKDGARVFLAPLAAALVDDQLLDAEVGGQGTVEFSLSRQR